MNPKIERRPVKRRMNHEDLTMTNDRPESQMARRLLMALLVAGLGLAACQEPGGADGASLQRDPGPPDEQVASRLAEPEELLAEAAATAESPEADVEPDDSGPVTEAEPAAENLAGPDHDLAPVAEPADEAADSDKAAEADATPETPDVAGPVATPTPRSVPTAPPAARTEPAPTATLASQPEEPVALEPAVSEAGPEPAVSEAEPEPAVAAPAQGNERPAPTLDLDGLETRLRKTKAIGLFTKLELKNEVGDLVKEVENYHRNRSNLNLSQLEERFDLLFMKLLLLLQDGDPPLHQLIADARPVLWTTLADPNQFANVIGT